MPRPAAVLTDIEGTTTPVSFVHDVLFPYARARLPAFLAAHAGDDAVREAAAMADGRPVLDALLGWMDADAKVTPLKTLQGMIWHEGYARGDLQGLLYPDVAPALRRWHGQGVTLGVYSSGSVAAQRLLFGHSDAGDLTGLFSGWFDTRVGFKREAASYAAIAGALGLAAEAVLFLSDVEAELDAAVAAGMCCCQLVRAQDGTVGSRRHETARDFGQLESRFGLGEASGPF